MTEPYPAFSVVVPTYSRPGPLAGCLQALRAQDYPHDRFEVVVVEDGGDHPSTSAVVRDSGLGARLIRKPNGGPASARNAGAAAAGGEFLAFTDDDCQPAPGWLKGFAAALRETPGDLWGGETVNQVSESVYAAASQQLLDFLREYYTDEAGSLRFVPSNNMALCRTLFEEIGGFDESFPLAAGEDREFCDRWRERSRRIRFAPAAKVGHYHRMGYREFIRQHFQYGRGAHHFHQSLSRRGRDAVRIEPLGFYQKMLAYPFRDGRGMGRQTIASALIAGSQTANAAGFLWERFHARNNDARVHEQTAPSRPKDRPADP